jgi:DNA invertase Pin-like site-specific DNA recombinase
MIRARCADGIKSAKARGVAFGRPKALTAHQANEARKRKAAGESLMSIAASYKEKGRRLIEYKILLKLDLANCAKRTGLFPAFLTVAAQGPKALTQRPKAAKC